MIEAYMHHEQYQYLDYLDQWTKPIDITLMEALPTKMQHGLVIGRFQPLHAGHIGLFKQALQIAETITIGIGSANVSNADNPFTAAERDYMVEKTLKKQGLMPFVRAIVTLDDHPDDSIWAKESLRKVKFFVGDINCVIGNNQWTNDSFGLIGYPAVTVPLMQRHIYEGKTIRAILREQGKIV